VTIATTVAELGVSAYVLLDDEDGRVELRQVEHEVGSWEWVIRGEKVRHRLRLGRLGLEFLTPAWTAAVALESSTFDTREAGLAAWRAYQAAVSAAETEPARARDPDWVTA